jgi:hypothetical protein
MDIKKMIMFILLVLVIMVIRALPDEAHVLKDLTRPDSLRVDNDDLYVAQGTTILVYSLKDFSITRKFGKAGFGFGELRRGVEWPNLIRVYNDHILVETENKLVYFNKEGTPLKEIRKPRDTAIFLPVGNHFVGKLYLHHKSSNIQYMRIVTCDTQANEIKEIYRQMWFQQYIPTGFQIQLFSDYLNYEVYDDKIFIEKSLDGLFIEVYDSDGNKLYQIRKPYEKMRVTPAEKEPAIAKLKNDEKGHLMIKLLGSWENVLKQMSITFPEYKPPMRNIGIDNNKIYVQTFKQQENKDEFIIMDLKGNILKTVFLPAGNRPGVEDKIYGVKYYTIVNDKYYYLKKNEEKNAWALHIEVIE